MKKRLFPNIEGEEIEWFDSTDDGDAAFWDEFMTREMESEDGLASGACTVEVVEGENGEIFEYRGVKLKEKSVRKLD